MVIINGQVTILSVEIIFHASLVTSASAVIRCGEPTTVAGGPNKTTIHYSSRGERNIDVRERPVLGSFFFLVVHGLSYLCQSVG